MVYEKCRLWIKLCGRPHKQLNVGKVTKHTYICSKVSLLFLLDEWFHHCLVKVIIWFSSGRAGGWWVKTSLLALALVHSGEIIDVQRDHRLHSLQHIGPPAAQNIPSKRSGHLESLLQVPQQQCFTMALFSCDINTVNTHRKNRQITLVPMGTLRECPT